MYRMIKLTYMVTIVQPSADTTTIMSRITPEQVLKSNAELSVEGDYVRVDYTDLHTGARMCFYVHKHSLLHSRLSHGQIVVPTDGCTTVDEYEKMCLSHHTRN